MCVEVEASCFTHYMRLRSGSLTTTLGLVIFIVISSILEGKVGCRGGARVRTDDARANAEMRAHAHSLCAHQNTQKHTPLLLRHDLPPWRCAAHVSSHSSKLNPHTITPQLSQQGKYYFAGFGIAPLLQPANGNRFWSVCLPSVRCEFAETFSNFTQFLPGATSWTGPPLLINLPEILRLFLSARCEPEKFSDTRLQFSCSWSPHLRL
mgnify:CR=1 FL=1